MTPLLPILRALSKESLRALDKFIHSPYHVSHHGVVLLFDYLKDNLADPALTKEMVLQAVFSKEADARRRFYHLTNYLLEAVEQFLAIELQAQQVHERNIATIQAIRKIQLSEPGAAMYRYARKRLENDPARGTEYLRYDYCLQLESYHLSMQQGRAKSFNVQELSTAQDVAFICEKLRTGCLLLSHQTLAKQTYDKGLLDPVLRFLEDHAFLQIPAVAVYYHGYYSQQGGEQGETHFQALKRLLQEHAGLFSVGETHDLFLMAINFCIRRINQSDESYFREIFELYQSGLQHGALLEDGVLSRWTYTNINMTALRLREYEWVKQFLSEYTPFLPENHREAAFHFNQARFHYDTGAYREAMQHLVKMEYDDVLQNLVAKVLLAKIYFELDETNALENQLDSIQIYLRRKKVLGYHKDNYNTIVRFFRKLLAVNLNNAKEVQDLQAQIEQSLTPVEQEWFLKQLR